MKIHAGIILFFAFLLHLVAPAQNAPISTAGNVSTYSSGVTMPITAINFNNIGSCNLKLTYDPAIANVTSVTAGPLLGGNLSTDITFPGIIGIGWFTSPGKTLPDNTVIFNVTFSKTTNGTTAVNFDDSGNACRWSNGNHISLNDLPTSTYYINGSVAFLSTDAPLTSAAAIIACPGFLVDIPVTVSAFNNIGKLDLNLQYSTSSLVYQSWLNNSGFPGLTVNSATPGTIVATGTVPVSGTGITLPDGSLLFTLQFFYSGGMNDLNWYDNGISCQYTGPPPLFPVLNDTPQTSFYFNGSVTPLPVPDPAGTISSSSGGTVCEGQPGVVFSVSPVANATGYFWSLPPGGIITGGDNTNIIIVDFDNDALSGDVFVSGQNTCGTGPGSPAYPIVVNYKPIITFQPLSPPPVSAGSGTASFKVAASGTGLTYKWQEFATSWTDIANGGVYSGALTDSLTITNPPNSMNGNRYRCAVTGTCGSPVVSDGMAILEVTPVGINDSGEESWGSKYAANNQLALIAHPNPFISQTTISYYLSETGVVQFVISNLLGESVEVVEGHLETQGLHSRTIPCLHVKGIYNVLLILTTKDKVQMKAIEIICNQ